LVNFQGTPEFGVMTTTSDAGCFEIDTGHDFTLADNFMLGLAQFDDKKQKVPVATVIFVLKSGSKYYQTDDLQIHADTEMKTQIEPIIKFYVSKFLSVQGTIIDFQSSSAVAGIIDFSTGPGLGMFGAEVSHNPNGLFTTTYSPS
jgi:hypothetical protein